MYEIKLKLFCPQCGKELSTGSIFQKDSMTCLKELRTWENKKTILQCPRCSIYLEYSGKYKKLPEDQTNEMEKIKNLFKKRRVAKKPTSKLF
jgi:uncharacterized C2H2 Zn-finger protein